jgi:pimeloyl-ACP methyl ester carboxylesterase
VNPFYFGTKAHRLFGAYDPPQGAGGRGVVICHPWAREYLLAYTTLRHLARQLAARGFHALRFDYTGTGDSAGDESDAGQERWLADIGLAIDELKDVGRVAQVGLVGMRYGAALAAQAAAARKDVNRLVLWDPVFDGPAYLEQLGVRPGIHATGVPVDVKGETLVPRLRGDLEALGPGSFGPGLPRTLVLDTTGRPGACEPLRARLAATGADCALEEIPDVQVWKKEWGGSGEGVGMAVAAVNRILEWLA